jgi:TP901 family phage tail tape measure protein
MFNSTLEIVIKARDEASAALTGLTGKLNGMQPAFKTMAAVGTVAFTAIAGVIYKSVEAADEANKVHKQMEAVLKSTGGAAGLFIEDLEDQADALAKVTTYGDEAVKSAQNLLLTFTNVKGGVFQESIGTILDMSTALGQDLKSSSIQVGKALNDPIKGITALSRVGVSFTEEQKEMIKGLVESGKTMEAQKVILAELNKEFGGSAAAAAQTFGGQVTQLKERLGELGEGIGKAIMPILQQLLEKIAPIIEKMIAWIEANPELTKNILIATAAIAGIVAVVGTLGVLLPAIITGFTLLAGPVGIIIAIFGALWFAIDKIIKIYKILRDDSDLIWEGIKIIIKEKIDAVVAFFQPLLDIIQKVIDGFKAIGQGVSNFAQNVKGGAGIVSDWITGKKAQGGNVSGGSSYLVGESGPEIFTPGGGGFVTANNRIGGAGGGITVNINGGNYLSEDAAMQMGDYIVQALKRVSRVGL